MSDTVAIPTPVIYIDAATLQDLKTNPDPVKVLTDSISVAYPHSGHFPGSIMSMQPDQTIRSYAVIVNALDGPIEGVDCDDVHGYWVGQPVVPDSKGVPVRRPTDSANLAGGQAFDWIDGIGGGQASVGIWTFEQQYPVFHGVSYVVQVTLTDESMTFVMSLIIDAFEQTTGVGANLYPASGANPPSSYDYYSAHDGNTVVPTTLKSGKVVVTIRLVTLPQIGHYMFAFVEPVDDGATPPPAPPAPPVSVANPTSTSGNPTIRRSSGMDRRR